PCSHFRFLRSVALQRRPHAWMARARSMASTPGSGARAEPLQKRRRAPLAFLRCARYRVPARPRPRAPRSAGPR
ncbi:unnamed protein product, partial [Pelagomonas calceolata]